MADSDYSYLLCAIDLVVEISKPVINYLAPSLLLYSLLVSPLYMATVMINVADMHHNYDAQEKALRDATDAGMQDLVEALAQLDDMVQ